MKPIIRNKRFFNNDRDSVWSHVASVMKTFFYIISLELRRKRKPFFTKEHDLSAWFVNEKGYPRAGARPAITWLGHASFLIQIGGLNILTDPVFSDCSRWYPRMVPVPLKLNELPPIDVILISHNHVDHMDDETLRVLAKQDSLILVPQGDGVRVKALGFANVQELQWGAQVQHQNVTLTFLPADHWSGRGIASINKSLWGSWLIQHADSTIYFAGDTVYSKHFAWIGQQYPSIDIVLMPIGPLHPAPFMKESHVDAPQAIQAFFDLNAKILIPMHWGTFRPPNDSFDEPLKELQHHWDKMVRDSDKMLRVVKFGERVSFE